MRRADAALVRAFDLLGRRWTGVVLGTLSVACRFRALSRAVEGISDSVLSDRLNALCNAGLATRTVDEGPPISVDYELTEQAVPCYRRSSRSPAGPRHCSPRIRASELWRAQLVTTHAFRTFTPAASSRPDVQALPGTAVWLLSVMKHRDEAD